MSLIVKVDLAALRQQQTQGKDRTDCRRNSRKPVHGWHRVKQLPCYKTHHRTNYILRIQNYQEFVAQSSCI